MRRWSMVSPHDPPPEAAMRPELKSGPNIQSDGACSLFVGMSFRSCPDTSPVAVSPFDYRAGICRASKEGRILGLASSGEGTERDHWSHYSALRNAIILDKFNTRPLDPDIFPVLRTLQQISCPQILELGPGAGLSASTLSRLCPQGRIDTVSLTPINPYLRFINDRVAPKEIDSEREIALTFECVGQPFITLQQIGVFPAQISLPPAHYHLIYESMGPLAHYRENQIGTGLSALAAAAVNALAADGVLFAAMECSSDCDALVSELLGFDRAGRFRVVRRKDAFDYVVFARSESPYFRFL